MKKIILIAICLFLAIMPSIPKVFATDEARSDESYIQIEPIGEGVLMAGGFHGGYGGGHYGGHYGGYHYYHHGPRFFGCAPVPPPMY